MFALGFFGRSAPPAACVPQKPGVRQITGTLVEVVLLVLVDVLLVDVLVLVLLVLVDVLVLVLEVLVLVDVLVLEVLVEVDVEVDVEVVPQLFVHESPLLSLPSSHASPELTCTTPSPQIVHGFSSKLSRHVLLLAVAIVKLSNTRKSVTVGAGSVVTSTTCATSVSGGSAGLRCSPGEPDR